MTVVMSMVGIVKYCNQEDGSGESRYMTCWTKTRSVLTRPKLKYLYLYILTMYPYIDICSKKDVCTIDRCYFCCSTKKEIMNSNHLMLQEFHIATSLSVLMDPFLLIRYICIDLRLDSPQSSFVFSIFKPNFSRQFKSTEQHILYSKVCQPFSIHNSVRYISVSRLSDVSIQKKLHAMIWKFCSIQILHKDLSLICPVTIFTICFFTIFSKSSFRNLSNL